MTDLTHLIGRLRELADWPHDVAGAQDDIRQAADALQSLTARVAGMEEALRPSADTKRAYIGEFKFQRTLYDQDGDETQETIVVPWDTTKEIMKAIAARAALNPVEGE